MRAHAAWNGRQPGSEGGTPTEKEGGQDRHRADGPVRPASEGEGGERLARATMKNRFRRTILRHSQAKTNITTMLNFFLDAHDDR